MSVAFALLVISCKNETPIDNFLAQTSQIYRNLIKNAKVEEITAEEYNSISDQEISFDIGGKGVIHQKTIERSAGLNIVFQMVESHDKKRYIKITGSSDDDLQNKLAKISMIGLKCYDYSTKKMDEVCKQQGIDAILQEYSSDLCTFLKKEIQKEQQNLLLAIAQKNNGFINDTIESVILTSQSKLLDLNKQYNTSCN